MELICRYFGILSYFWRVPIFMFLLMKLLSRSFCWNHDLSSLGEAGEQENVNETVKYGETWHQHNAGRVLGCGWRGEMEMFSVSPWGERWTELGMIYFLLNEAKEPQNPKNHKIVFLDVFFPLCHRWSYLTFFRGIVAVLFPADPEESYYLPKELVQQLSSWKDATSLVNGSLWLWRKHDETISICW